VISADPTVACALPATQRDLHSRRYKSFAQLPCSCGCRDAVF